MTEQLPVRFDTKIVLVLHRDLPVWQQLNMTAFLSSGIASRAAESIGEPYVDGDGSTYLPMFGQPVLVFEADGAELARTLERALSRSVTPAVFTSDLFATGHDAANRAALASLPRAELALTGLGFRTERRDARQDHQGAAPALLRYTKTSGRGGLKQLAPRAEVDVYGSRARRRLPAPRAPRPARRPS